jgi:hypothetical protein
VSNAAGSGGETRPPTTSSPRTDRPADEGGSGAVRPRLLRGLAYGIGMAFLFVLVWTVMAAILDLSAGLVVLGAAAGWLTGTAVALGAEPGTMRRQRSTILLAVAVALGIWIAGTALAYGVSLAILPGSTLDLFGRMANAPFLETVAAGFVPGGPLTLAALALFAWLGAR